MRSVLVLTVLTLFGASAASAQSFGIDETPGGMRTVLTAASLSTGASVVPSVVGTLLWQSQDGVGRTVGIGLVAAGYVFGPSAGSYYLDDSGRAWRGMAIRAAGATAFTAGLVLGFGGVTRDETELTFGSALLSISAIVVPYGLAYNFTTLSQSHSEMELRLSTAFDVESRAPFATLVLTF
jgi:hypothetical protein